MFIGNIDKSINFDEVKKYFYNRYSSIISIKHIVDSKTGKSKGYGFIEFTCYAEFNKAITQKDPLIFGKQKLVFNSAKNRYEDEEMEIKENKNSELANEDPKSFANNSKEIGDFSGSISKSEEEIGVSNDSRSFLGGKNKPDEKKFLLNNDFYNPLTLQIKNALSKVSNYYFNNETLLSKFSIFNYHLGNLINSDNKSLYNNNQKEF